MNDTVLMALDVVQGPVFRFAIALMLLGIVRAAFLTASDAVGAYLVSPDAAAFKRKLRLHVLWALFPSLVMRELRPNENQRMFLYHMCLCCLSLIMRLGAVLLPVFMLAHVYLWKRGLGLGYWPALPGVVADTLAIITMVAAFALFLGRLYSPLLRKLEPTWSFFKPLILLVPFLTGYLAMHPLASPLDYHVVRLLHVASACVVFVMIPFGRMLSCMHTPLAQIAPEAAWSPPPQATAPAAGHRPLSV